MLRVSQAAYIRRVAATFGDQPYTSGGEVHPPMAPNHEVDAPLDELERLPYRELIDALM
jgi:hypothetical protein